MEDLDGTLLNCRKEISGGSFSDAFKELALSNSQHPEKGALKVLALLGMNRLDLAGQESAKVANVDLFLNQIMEAWVNLASVFYYNHD